MRKTHSSQAGSALIMILIGVALFAALSYTVAQMMRGGDGATSIADDKAGIYASEVLSYTRTVRQAVQGMRIENGCDDSEISFENTTVGGYTNGTNTRCQVFHPDGGALGYVIPQESWLDSSKSAETRYKEWYFSGYDEIDGVGNSNVAQLIVYMPWVTQNFCNKLNEELGISGDTTNDGTFDTTQKFVGIYNAAGITLGDTDDFDGKMSGCFEDDQGDFFFYQVLIAR